MAAHAHSYLTSSPAQPFALRRRQSSDPAPPLPSLFAMSALSQQSSTSPGSSSASDESSPPSLLFSSTSASPASSLSSSPSLDPKRSSLPFPPPFSLDAGQPTSAAQSKPSPTQVAVYASNIIRNEAYALLALAARLAPAAHPLHDEDGAYFGHTASASPSSSSSSSDDSGEGSQTGELMPPDLDEPVSGGTRRDDVLVESRTNVAFRQCVDLCTSMPGHGKILVTGVGKSGIAARKMVATFCSLGPSSLGPGIISLCTQLTCLIPTGVQAVFLHPLEALHGDLGVVCPCSPSSPCDTLLMISHSGATAELMRLLPIVRPRVRSLIAVTRDPDSVLARSCHGWLDAGTGVYPAGMPKGTTDEADSALPAPTSSVVSALAIGDALALTLSRLKIGWDADGKERRLQFFHCHPGGQLGIQVRLLALIQNRL